MTLAETAKEFPFIMQTFAFCVGACIGSFLNVCIFRIPKGESIATPPSHCKCGAKINWYCNIPILSWLFLKGRAKCCGSKISFRYPLVETLTAVLFLALWMSFPPMIACAYMGFVSLMIFCAFVDLDTMFLPDFATIGGAIVGVILSTILPQIQGVDIEQTHPLIAHLSGLGLSVIGVIIASGVIYWIRLLSECIFRREAMGEGDVILLGCIGAFCGWQGAIFALFGGALLGCIILLPIIAVKQISSKKSESEIEVPFGPWLALGSVVYIFCAEIINAYLQNFANIFA